MKNIKNLKIRGLKKFEELDVLFNENMNILVGENEAGKSTILEAINIVLNKKYNNVDRAVLKDLFNINQVRRFEEEPSIESLPKISIEITFNLDTKTPNSEYFYGEVNEENKEDYGIVFECMIDQELKDLIENEVNKKIIPYEYYSLSWKTFAGLPYKTLKRPLEFLSIDISNNDGNSAFNYFNKNLFNSKYDDKTRLNVRHNLRSNLNESFEKFDLKKIDDIRKFGINDKKIILENILSIYEEDIPLENKGKGMESLIKTQIALDKQNSKIDLILLEEPENHLSYTNMLKMIYEIANEQDKSQIILTTHSDLIASRLNLKNILWVRDTDVKSLKGIDEGQGNNKISNFFTKCDSNNILKLILAKKIILVEGPTEYLLIPKFYEQLTGNTIEEDNISIISCGGVLYKKYLPIAKKTDKKIAVITDNDEKQDNIKYMKDFNGKEQTQHIFMDESIENWTWEVCLYNLNKDFFDSFITLKKGCEYKFKGKDWGAVLGKMLNNKVDTAYQILMSDQKLNIPKYVGDAILWLRE